MKNKEIFIKDLCFKLDEELISKLDDQLDSQLNIELINQLNNLLWKMKK